MTTSSCPGDVHVRTLMESSLCRTQRAPREEVPGRLVVAALEGGAPTMEIAEAAAAAVWAEFWQRPDEPDPFSGDPLDLDPFLVAAE